MPRQYASLLCFPNGWETIRNCFIIGPGWKVRTGVFFMPASRPEEDSVVLVNLSSCCKNFLNASYHLLLMLSRLGWKPGGFPAPSCPTYNGVILDLFPVIPASSSVSSAYSWAFLIFFFFLTTVALCPESSLLGQKEFLWCWTSAGFFNCVHVLKRKGLAYMTHSFFTLTSTRLTLCPGFAGEWSHKAHLQQRCQTARCAAPASEYWLI